VAVAGAVLLYVLGRPAGRWTGIGAPAAPAGAVACVWTGSGRAYPPWTA